MPIKPKRILWPTDFSPMSLHGAKYARGLCEKFGAELHLLHVVVPPVQPEAAFLMQSELAPLIAPDELLSTARETLAQVVTKEFSGMANVHPQAVLGTPWLATCEYARKAKIDLIVVATHGHTGLKHILLGSTAERIVQHAPCPVLVVKNNEGGFLTD